MDSEKQHIEALDKTARYSGEQFDKNIVFIASGALGVSFAFIKDIIPNFKDAEEKWTLISSWYIFAIVIFISLICHYLSTRAHNWALDNQNLDTTTFNNKIKYWNTPIHIMNLTMILGILIGALFLIYFIQKNI
jgi:hypothetical protein